MLSGCGGDMFATETNGKENDTVNEEQSKDQKFLEALRDLYDSDHPEDVLNNIEKQYEEIKDENIKGELLELADKTALKILDITEDPDDFSIDGFFIFFGRNSNDLRYEEFLTDETADKLYHRLNPLFDALRNEEFNVNFVEKYNDAIKIDESQYNVMDWVRGNDFEYKPLTDSSKYDPIDDPNDMIVLDDGVTIVEFRKSSVNNIFQIEDDEGNLLDPHKKLKDIVKHVASIENDRANEAFKIRQAKEKEKERESKTVRIGMSDEEVLKRWGEPEDINKTITEDYVKEQWVYDNGRYLYFEDGVLTTIQN